MRQPRDGTGHMLCFSHNEACQSLAADRRRLYLPDLEHAFSRIFECFFSQHLVPRLRQPRVRTGELHATLFGMWYDLCFHAANFTSTHRSRPGFGRRPRILDVRAQTSDARAHHEGACSLFVCSMRGHRSLFLVS
eukprot:scaffold48392_cov31-Tisochrysis_lutea.AAC.3